VIAASNKTSDDVTNYVTHSIFNTNRIQLRFTTLQVCRYLVKCQCLKSNNWKQDDFYNNTF